MAHYLVGSITVDKDFLRITNALELHTSQRMTEFGLKDDSTLAPWLQFTDDKTFVYQKIRYGNIYGRQNISSYYEVILDRLSKQKKKVKTLSARRNGKIYRLADQMDQMQKN